MRQVPASSNVAIDCKWMANWTPALTFAQPPPYQLSYLDWDMFTVLAAHVLKQILLNNNNNNNNMMPGKPNTLYRNKVSQIKIYVTRNCRPNILNQLQFHHWKRQYRRTQEKVIAWAFLLGPRKAINRWRKSQACLCSSGLKGET
jgi:hypothetical protein